MLIASGNKLPKKKSNKTQLTNTTLTNTLHEPGVVSVTVTHVDMVQCCRCLLVSPDNCLLCLLARRPILHMLVMDCYMICVSLADHPHTADHTASMTPTSPTHRPLFSKQYNTRVVQEKQSYEQGFVVVVGTLSFAYTIYFCQQCVNRSIANNLD